MPGKTSNNQRGGSAPSRRGGKAATIQRPFSTVNHTARAASSSPVAAVPAAVKPAQVANTAVLGNGVVGTASGLLTAGLRPIARVEVMSQTRHVTFNGTVGVLSSTNVCDPTGNATDALGVDDWANRFGGFQQYRVRRTRWVLTPIRPIIGSATATQGGGHVGVWIQDSPQTGSPTTTQFQQANREMVVINSDHIKAVVYETNEPQDLNLVDITASPTHVTNQSLQAGQHCFQIYGDDTVTGMIGYASTGFPPVFTVTALYDIEFFGVGGV